MTREKEDKVCLWITAISVVIGFLLFHTFVYNAKACGTEYENVLVLHDCGKEIMKGGEY